jgi:hypothetical protein
MAEEKINMIFYLDVNRGYTNSLVISISCLKFDLKSYSKLAKCNGTFYYIILTLSTISAVWKNSFVSPWQYWLWPLLTRI